MQIALSILPILLTIACGYVVMATGVIARDKWEAINTLSFRVLIPAVLISTIAVSDLSAIAFGAVIWSMLATLFVAGLIIFALRWSIPPARLPNPAFTTLFQTTTRWNAFIALAAAEQFAGQQGLAILALAMAVLIPVINVANIVVLSSYGPMRMTTRQVVLTIVKNPLVQGCLIGLAINLTGAALPAPLLQTLDLIGRAAIGIGLLAVGAGIGIKRLFRFSWALWAGVSLRLAVCPALFLIFAHVAGLGPVETLTGALVFAVPAATNGYIIARQMGGDADLYADILTWQTLLSMLLLPVLAVTIGVS